MPRQCTVCSHEDSVLINEALVVHKQGNRRIASQYELSEAAIRRHREHIPRLLVNASEAMEISDAGDLLGRVEDLHARTLAILEAAEETEDLRTALGAIREARGNLELLAKIRQLIDQAPQTNILINHPEFVQVQAEILVALESFPEARGAVVRALKSGGNGAG